MRLSDGSFADGLQLFALSGIALAAPLLRLLADHTGVLVAHGSTPAELGILVGGLLAIPPLLAWLGVRGARRADARLGSLLQATLVGALAACFLLPPLRLASVVPGALLLGVAGVAGAGFAIAFTHRAGVRRFVAWLALLPPALVLGFLNDDGIATLLRARTAPAMATPVPPGPPVVFVIFDELPTVSLLDENAAIDPVRYPHFAALAAHSTWFRNATTVGASTLEAVPAIVTGRYPSPPDIATYVDYPGNLFSLLEGAYEMRVQESQTILFAGQRRGEPSGTAVRLGHLVSDLRFLLLHALAPADLATLLPDVTQTWKDFAPPDIGDLHELSQTNYRSRAARFEHFVRNVEPCPGPCLLFVHSLLPHVPWHYTDGGRRYYPNSIPGLRREFWGPGAWWVVQGYQRHLLQVALTDRLLGDLVEALRSANLYERSIVVVTADHGSSYWPRSSRRDPDVTRHPGDILKVPLFIKTPHQDGGAVSDRPVETIDVLPTLADLLGVRIPWAVEGCSVFDPGCPERASQTIVDNAGHRYAFEAARLEHSASLERKLRLFGSGEGARIFRIGPYKALVGRSVADVPTRPLEPVPTIELGEDSFAIRDARPDEYVVARLIGRFESGGGAPRHRQVAIATQGRIRAVVPSFAWLASARSEPKQIRYFSAMLPGDAPAGDRSRLELFFVDGTPAYPVLRPVAFRLVDFDLPPLGKSFTPPPRGAK